MKLLVKNIATLAGIDGGGVLKKCGEEMAQFGDQIEWIPEERAELKDE